MKSVNVCISTTIASENLQRIANVSPRINLTSIADLFREERHGIASATEILNTILAETEVLFGLRFPDKIIERSPNLKWMHVFLSGVDKFLNSHSIVKSPVILTKTTGIQSVAMSEFIMGQILMFSKRAPDYFLYKQEKRWERLESSTLRSKTLGIIGLGNVGRELARFAKSFGMRVLATRRSVKKATTARNVDALLPLDQLHQILSESDFVALTLPLTHETQNMIGKKELQVMKPTSYIINISRGSIINEESLVEALSNLQIAGAGLDVFSQEPLPPTNKLWELPNVIFSPHIAASMEDYPILAVELFCENLRRYLEGKKLLNIVNKRQRY